VSTQKSRRDATVQALVDGMARGRAKRVRVLLPASRAAEARLSNREKVLRAAWFRGQVNARHGWKRKPPRRWCRWPNLDVERGRFFYQGYDAMLRQRLSGRGVTLMSVPDSEHVAHRYAVGAGQSVGTMHEGGAP